MAPLGTCSPQKGDSSSARHAARDGIGLVRSAPTLKRSGMDVESDRAHRIRRHGKRQPASQARRNHASQLWCRRREAWREVITRFSTQLLFEGDARAYFTRRMHGAPQLLTARRVQGASAAPARCVCPARGALNRASGLHRGSAEAFVRRAADVTWVLCGTKGQYETELTDQQRFCIHPCVADSFWNPTRQPMANGTISLAMKHKGAYIDMMDRNLPSAIVLEDDAHLQPTIWEHLNTVRLPADATIYYLGSYTQGDNVFTSKWGDARHEKLHGQRPTGLSVHERNSSLWPAILGGVGYVMFPPGARELGERPIITTADIELSVEPDTYRIDCTFDEKGRPKFSLPGTPGFRECSNSCTVRDGSGHSKTFKLGSPNPQFGPSRWLVWPEKFLKGGTHINRA